MRKLTDIIKVDHELLPPGFKREKTLKKASAATLKPSGGSVLPRSLKRGGRAWRKRQRERAKSIELSVERAQRRKKKNSEYYHANKARLNRERSIRNQLPEYIYAKAKQRAGEKGIDWEFDFDSWMARWLEAPRILDAESGYYVTAWSKRGPIFNRDAQLVRKDTSLGWSEENTHVVYMGEEITDDEERFN